MTEQLPNITFVEGIHVPEEGNQLIVLDDLMVDATKNKDVSNLFTVGSHHNNTSVICLLQNLFYQGKENRTMNLNSQYLILFKNPRDQLQVSYLARQMYPHNIIHFMDKYQKVTSKPYGCLVVDLKQETHEADRLKDGNIQPPCDVIRNLHSSPPIHDRDQPLSGHLQSGTQAVNTSEKRAQEVEIEKKEEQRAIMQMCKDCGLVFQTPYFLQKHRRKRCEMQDDTAVPCTHKTEVSLSTATPSNTTAATPQSRSTCLDCGITFQSPYHLGKHKCQCVSDDDSSNDDCSDDDNECWRPLVNAAYKEHDDQYGRKFEKLEKEGLTETEADKEVTQELMPQYTKSLAATYRRFATQMHCLGNNAIHREISNMVAWYRARGYTFDMALTKAMRKKRHLFEEVLDDFEEQREESEEESEDSDAESGEDEENANDEEESGEDIQESDGEDDEEESEDSDAESE